MTKDFRILAGITNDDELYFLELNRTNERRNGYDEFTMSGFTVKPIREEAAKENANNYLDDEGEYLWRQAVECKNTTLGLDEWIEQVKDEDEMGSFDNSLFTNEVEVDGETWLFESQSCGQHEESGLKHYFIDKKLYSELMKLWKQYMFKTIEPNTMAEDIYRWAEEVAKSQDEDKLCIEAIEMIEA